MKDGLTQEGRKSTRYSVDIPGISCATWEKGSPEEGKGTANKQLEINEEGRKGIDRVKKRKGGFPLNCGSKMAIVSDGRSDEEHVRSVPQLPGKCELSSARRVRQGRSKM